MSDLPAIYAALKTLLAQHQPPFVVKMDTAGAPGAKARYDLFTHKPVVIDTRKFDEIEFASVIIQKDYVGFYFMPIYMHDEVKALLAPDLLKLLKGKTCFHIKKLDDNLLAHIGSALQTGQKIYQERGWI